MRFSLFDPDSWHEIFATLSRNKTRTFLTAFGIFWGTAMLAMLYGGSRGMSGMLKRNFAGFSTNCAAVFPNERSESFAGFNKGSSWTLNNEDVRLIRQFGPQIDEIAAISSSSGSGVAGTKSKTGTVLGVDQSYSAMMLPQILEGRFVNNADIASSAKVVVLGKNVATELFGMQSPVGQNISLNGVFYTVIGVVDQLSEISIGGRISESYLIPITTLQRTFNLGDRVHFMVFTAPAGHGPGENEDFIRKLLGKRHYFNPADTHAMEFEDISEQFEQIEMLFSGISLLALFVGGGSLLAGVIGVGNIMWIIVKERTREIGIRRAIGAKPLDIMAQVLCEAIVLTLVAGTAGVCFAVLALGITDTLTADPLLGKAGFEISLSAAITIILTFFILGSAAGTIPALRTLKIKPIEALNDK